MRFDLQVQGLDGLRRASRLAPKQFDTVMRHAVRVSAIQMRHVMIEEASAFAVGGRGGRFVESIRYRLRGLRADVGSVAPSAFSIERGRRSGETVPLGIIRRWVRARGLVRGVFDVGTKQLNRTMRRHGLVNAETEEAIRVVSLIRQRGTTPKLYGQRTVERSQDRVLRNFRDSVAKALRGLAQLQRRAA